MKRIFNKIKNAISNFWRELKLTCKVQKGALVRVLGKTILPIVLVVAAIAFVWFPVIAGYVFIGAAILFALIQLAVLKHEYSKVVKESASIQVKVQNRKAFKRRKRAAKESKLSADYSANAQRVDEKYNK